MSLRSTAIRAATKAMHERWCGPDCRPDCRKWSPDQQEIEAGVTAILVIPEIAAALRQAKMIADEPTRVQRPTRYPSPATASNNAYAAGVNDFLARLRKAATDG